MIQVDDLLRIAVEQGASDLHIKAGSPPTLRVDGQLVPAGDQPALTPADTNSVVETLLSLALRRQLDDGGEVDFALSVPGLSRFRCNVFRQRGTTALALRVIPRTVPSLEELLLPPVLGTIAELERGLVIVTGTSGAGKSTTLAAVLGRINRTRRTHIVTIEDPIEYLHRDELSIISQREIRTDTGSFAQALRSALRQDPDVILVGEMRDLETIETALMAAETGHLVLSTLHTLDAPETINRIVSAFPTYRQEQVRAQLAGVLQAVVSQRLLPRSDVAGRCPAVEVMVATPFIRGCILDTMRTDAIRGAIKTGRSQYGMQTFDDSLYDLYAGGLVSFDHALRSASSPDEFTLRVQGISAAGEISTPDSLPDAQAPGGIIHYGR